MKYLFLFAHIVVLSVLAEAITIDDLYEISSRQESTLGDFLDQEPNTAIKIIVEKDWKSKPQSFLFLDSLKDITIDIAKCLRNWDGRYLFLNGIKKISPEVMTILVSWDGHLLCLNGVLHLEPESIKYLEYWQGYYLSLNRLQSITASDAYFVGLFSFLRLNGIANISAGVAENLSHKNIDISLDGIESMDTIVICELLKNHPRIVRLNSIKKIPKDFFEETKSWYGTLSLSGIEDLGGEDLNGIAEWQGRVLYLNGVKKISEQACAALANWPGKVLYLDNLETLNDNQFRFLSSWQGYTLSLNKISYISQSSMLCLSNWQGFELHINGLKEISPDILFTLAKWRGFRLHIMGLRLNEEQAKVINSWEGFALHVAAKESFSKKTIRILEQNTAVRWKLDK